MSSIYDLSCKDNWNQHNSNQKKGGGPTNSIKHIHTVSFPGAKEIRSHELYRGYDGILSGFVISLALAESCLDFREK